VPRLLLAALLASATLAGTAHAQEYAGRPMPSYDDGEPIDPRGYYDSYGTADARYDDASPVDEQRMADYRAANHWVQPRPYSRADQVEQGTSNDAAHRADRAYTAELNRNAKARSRSSMPRVSGRDQTQYRADLDAHSRDMAQYRADRARYDQRIANWHSRANACEAGYYDACE
jgi:hypothetical protein